MLSATTGLGIFPAPHSAKNITIFEIPETPPLSCTFNLKNTSAIQIFWRILLEQPGVHRHFYKKRLSCDSYLLYFCATYTELILSPYQITSRKFNSEVQPWFINIINMVWYIDSRPRLIAVWHFSAWLDSSVWFPEPWYLNEDWIKVCLKNFVHVSSMHWNWVQNDSRQSPKLGFVSIIRSRVGAAIYLSWRSPLHLVPSKDI